MELKDIITQDSDRLFILDNECYIIFTGDTVQDEKPFIRIGNWINLPVELIPLIENIIITDLIVGNPSYEQFNIDVNYLPTNRYIGSDFIVKRYLNFQKAFGLDLTNAAIVDIEKDIPVVSRKKILSDQESFIGIFYTDGNFRITHRKNNIFNLKDVEEKNLHATRIHDLLSAHGRETGRYAGSGLVFLENNPLFYRNRLFTSYHFPKNYYEAFSRLHIDPAQIRELILPSSNLMNITRLLKWKHRSKGRVRIFSDHKDEMDLVSRLFSNATIIRAGFQGLSFDTGEGLGIRNYPGTFNIKLSYKKAKPALEDVTIAYIKGSGGLESIIKDSVDALLVSYPVYEEANLLFKGTSAPVVVHVDTPSRAGRFSGGGPLAIFSGIHYEFLKYNAAETLVSDISASLTNMELPDLVNEKDADKIPGAVKSFSYATAFDSAKDAFNLVALLKTQLHTTVSRKFASSLSKAISDLEKAIRHEEILANRDGSFKINLAFCGKSLVQFLEVLRPEKPADTVFILDDIDDTTSGSLAAIPDPQTKRYYQKILDDRRRMLELLKLFAPQTGAYKEISALREAIRKKKELYQDDVSVSADSSVRKAVWGIRLKKAARIVVVPVLLIALAAGAYTAYTAYQRYRIYEKSQKEKRYVEEITRKFKIHVSDTEIFSYVNQVALKNGYAPLTYKTMREKNPDWIFPGNIFYMLDGEKITVKQGDTLWGISHKKLLNRYLDFYRTIEEITREREKGRDAAREIDKARALATTERQRALLKELTDSQDKR